MDDDAHGGDDIFTAEVKSRKRKNDDYAEDESDEEVLPKPKRVVSRAQRGAIKEEQDEEEEEAKSTPAKARTNGRKRKSPASESDEDEDSEVAKPRKKAAATKSRAPKAKAKEDGKPDDPTVTAILDAIPIVRPPTPPPKDPDAKFDWRKANAGGGNSGPAPMAGALELPVGQPNCLAGQTFVFTGLLKTIGRDEAQALVKQYGGKVTTAPSSKTKWVVLGDDAGPSKLAKIRDLKIRTIDENGLFKLIRELPAGGGDTKEAEKFREKERAEEDKVKQGRRTDGQGGAGPSSSGGKGSEGGGQPRRWKTSSTSAPTCRPTLDDQIRADPAQSDLWKQEPCGEAVELAVELG